MKSRLFRNSLLGLCAIGLALSPTIASASGVTISAGPGSLTGKVALTVPLTVSCGSPFWDPSSQELFGEEIYLNVEQASGKSIAHGSGSAFASTPGPLFVQCDGRAATIPVTVLADPSGPPFHGGTAVITGGVILRAGTNCGFPGCYFNLVSDGAGLGAQAIKVH